MLIAALLCLILTGPGAFSIDHRRARSAQSYAAGRARLRWKLDAMHVRLGSQRHRAAIITGGKRIGAAVAVALAQRGMHVALSFNRSRSEAEASPATDIEAAGRRAFVYQADLSRGERRRRWSTRRPPTWAGSTC